MTTVSMQHGRTSKSWHMKWIRNKHAFCQILDYRRSVSSSLHREETTTTLKDRSPKRSRIDNHTTHSTMAPISPPLTASPSVEDLTDERTALRHATMWFLESIATKKPANDGEILAIWTTISAVSLDSNGMQILAMTLRLGCEGERSIHHFSHETLLYKPRFV